MSTHDEITVRQYRSGMSLTFDNECVIEGTYGGGCVYFETTNVYYAATLQKEDLSFSILRKVRTLTISISVLVQIRAV